MKEFTALYDEISKDLIQRVDEVQEVYNLCKIANDYQVRPANKDKALATITDRDEDKTDRTDEIEQPIK